MFVPQRSSQTPSGPRQLYCGPQGVLRLLGVLLVSLLLWCLGPSPAQSAPALLPGVTQVKTASEPSTASEPVAASTPVAASAPEAEPTGLLDKLGGQIDNLGTQIKKQLAPLEAWRVMMVGARADLITLLSSQHQDTFLDFMLIMTVWIVMAWIINRLGLFLRRRYFVNNDVSLNPTTKELAIHLLRRIGPWIGSFLLVLVILHYSARSFGNILGLLISYSAVAGAILATLCIVLVSISSGGHRRAAARILMNHNLWLLWLSGSMCALADAFSNDQIIQNIGLALSNVLGTITALGAALCIGAYIILSRRPISHLIFNCSLASRRKSKTLSETRELIARVWHFPILLLLGFSVVKILMSAGSPGNLLNLIVVSIGLLLVTTFIILLIRRRLNTPATSAVARRKSSAYYRRLSKIFYTLLYFAIWVGCARLIAHLWGWSFEPLLKLTMFGHPLGGTVKSIMVTVIIAWIIWTVLDIAIQESIASVHSKGKKVNARALTILPLLRNVLIALVVMITGTIILANMGIDITPLWAGAGVIGIAVGFGAQSLVQDLITGLFILFEDSISVGDYIEVSNHAGTVENLSIRTVRLRDAQGSLHSIPFSQIKTIRNYARDYSYALFDIGVAYSTDMNKAFRAIREVGSELASTRHKHNLLGPVEIMGVQSFADNAIILRARLKTRPLQQWEIGRAFNLALLKKFNQQGIEFPFPQRDVHLNMVNPEAAEPIATTDKEPVQDKPSAP